MHCRLLPSVQTLHRASASPLERRVPTNSTFPSASTSPCAQRPRLQPRPVSPPGTILSAPMAPPQGSGGGTGAIQVVHTDDAATKLSDRVRRRCFNCCTTDASTWRRSNLSPGNVITLQQMRPLRTHALASTPEQFPHKPGPLASSTLRSRTPPRIQPYQTPAHYPPPDSGSYPTSASASAPAPPTARPLPLIPLSPPTTLPLRTAPPHPGMPNPQSVNPSPKLPGVDSLRPPSRDEHREREERDDRWERSPE
ncbi:hypothetical protein B0H13DRAFT_694676 [Mycena leptocephala]|nr:hypothetical protein B0H13DRAFT_694676 [Mycena leptocephala]